MKKLTKKELFEMLFTNPQNEVDCDEFIENKRSFLESFRRYVECIPHYVDTNEVSLIVHVQHKKYQRHPTKYYNYNFCAWEWESGATNHIQFPFIFRRFDFDENYTFACHLLHTSNAHYVAKIISGFGYYSESKMAVQNSDGVINPYSFITEHKTAVVTMGNIKSFLEELQEMETHIKFNYKKEIEHFWNNSFKKYLEQNIKYITTYGMTYHEER